MQISSTCERVPDSQSTSVDRMMSLVSPPQQRRKVLQAMKPVDIEIVAHEEEHELRGDWPGPD